MAYTLPDLPYPKDALEPHIDAKTMEIHHGKHHAAYVNNLNKALEGHEELAKKSIEDLMRDLSKVPESIRNAVRNNGGGHVNHSMFWLDHEKGRRRSPQRRAGQGHRQEIQQLRQTEGTGQQRRGDPLRQRLGLAVRWTKPASCTSAPPPTKTRLTRRGTRRFSAWTCGSTPTICSIRTAGPTTSPPGGTRWIGMQWRSATPTRPGRIQR